MRNKIDLTVHKYGMLTVLSFVRTGNNYQNYWLCRCDCGSNHTVVSGALRNGNTKSCGCYGKECTSKRMTTHGETKGKAGQKKDYHKLYGVWCSIKSRCYSPSNHAYARYGGRGISMEIKWKNSFPLFKEWSLSNGWEEGLHIDRIDNDGSYSPENCRFVTPKINANNMSTNRPIEFNGEIKSVKEWADELGIKYQTLYCRVFEKNYPIEKAMNSHLYKTNGIEIKET